jgi:hypothetical protein
MPASACAGATERTEISVVSATEIRFERKTAYRSRVFLYDKALRCRVITGTVSTTGEVSPRDMLGRMMHVWLLAEGAHSEAGSVINLPFEKRLDL